MELSIDDLRKICSQCNGTGVVTDPPNTQRRGGGYGPQPVRGFQRETYCTACRKSGYVLTATGEAIAELLEVLRKQGRI